MNGFSPNPSSPCILVVDDSEDILKLLNTALSQAGFVVSLARNGREALPLLSANSGKSINLVVSDIHMPEMTGVELLNEIKRLHSHIPIILITGTPGTVSREEALKLGAVDLLMKPLRVSV